jgi:uncharacterized protein
MESSIVYFEDISASHTEEVFRLAKKRATELGIKDIVIASTSGETALKAVNFFKGFNVVVVGLSSGIFETNVSLFSEDKRKIVESAGGKVVLAAPAFAGVGGAPREQSHNHQNGALIADTLRIFGQGMKVTCEIVLEAADAGLVRSNEPIISIAGTGRWKGADTAIVVSPVNSNRFFDIKVHEIICKPRLWPS